MPVAAAAFAIFCNAKASDVPALAGARLIPPPAGFISFCLRFPDQCDAPANEPMTVSLDSARWRLLRRVNTAVNQTIWPEDDTSHYGRPEYWTIPSDGYGDCEDYALTKRRDLILAGFPRRALRIAIAETPLNGRHAVLIVMTESGAFILDNLLDAIVEIHQSAYRWIEQQDASNPRAWITLTDPTTSGAATAVGSVK